MLNINSLPSPEDKKVIKLLENIRTEKTVSINQILILYFDISPDTKPNPAYIAAEAPKIVNCSKNHSGRTAKKPANKYVLEKFPNFVFNSKAKTTTMMKAIRLLIKCARSK